MRAIIAFVACTLLAGCSSYGPGQTAGTVLGAVGGGVLGSTIGSGTGQLWATGAGAVLGAWAGNEIGSSIDQSSGTGGGPYYYTSTGRKVMYGPPYGVHPTYTCQYLDAYNRVCRNSYGQWAMMN